MRNVRVARDILPLGEFKTHASAVLRKLRENHRPVVVTQNGKPAAVLIEPEEFDELRQRAEFVSAVQEGLADSEAGRVVSDRELGRELDAEFGPHKRRR